VEWGGGLAEGLAEAHLEVRLHRPADDRAGRSAELLPRGGDWADRLAAVPDPGA
jgi:tRNA threonylcarbamoyladenosine biosynthesis protein TsaE